MGPSIEHQISTLSQKLGLEEGRNGPGVNRFRSVSQPPPLVPQMSTHRNGGNPYHYRGEMKFGARQTNPDNLPQRMREICFQRMRSASSPIQPHEPGGVRTISPGVRVRGGLNPVSRNPNVHFAQANRHIPSSNGQTQSEKDPVIQNGPVLRGDGTDMKGVLNNCMLPVHLLIPSPVVSFRNAW